MKMFILPAKVGSIPNSISVKRKIPKIGDKFKFQERENGPLIEGKLVDVVNGIFMVDRV